MWTFKTMGDEGDKPTGFEATFEGPVENAGSALVLVSEKAAELVPAARTLAQQSANLVLGLVKDTKNGKRRLSMTLHGGAGKQLAFSMRLELNLAEDPEA